MTHPRQIEDVLDCGRPRETWETLRDHLKRRAVAENETAFSLEQDAKDALEQAKAHHEAAKEFYALYEALANAPVTFAASADTHPKGGDVQQAPLVSGAVPPTAGDAQ